MKTRRAIRTPKRIMTTLGDLISAAYEAADGFGKQKVERAAQILSNGAVTRRLSRQLQFVR